MSLPTLYEIVSEYRQQASQLAELDLDDQTISDTLESLQWPVEDKARAVAAVIGNLDAHAGLVKEFAKRKADEAKRMQARADYLRKYLLDAMLATGISEIQAIDGSLTIKTMMNPPSVVIDDMRSLSDEFLYIPPIPAVQPDKKAIADAIKRGEDVPGAHLEQTMRISIR